MSVAWVKGIHDTLHHGPMKPPRRRSTRERSQRGTRALASLARLSSQLSLNSTRVFASLAWLLCCPRSIHALVGVSPGSLRYEMDHLLLRCSCLASALRDWRAGPACHVCLACPARLCPCPCPEGYTCNNQALIAKYGLLFQAYKPRYWWFELLQMYGGMHVSH